MKLLSVFLAATLGLVTGFQGVALAADASTLHGKILAGYQGWFRCPEKAGSTRYERYFAHDRARDYKHQKPGARRWGIDMWPETSEMDASSLCEIEGRTKGGKKLFAFTALAPATQQTHFRWMREHDIDGVLFQRFLYRLKEDYSEDDQVLKNVIAAARDQDRVFAVEYDVTDYKGDAFSALQSDWQRLTQRYKLTKAKNYQHHKGKPVVSLWGFGIDDGRHIDDPEEALRIIKWFQSQGVRVMGGVPGGWNSLNADSVKDPRWTAVYAAFDIIQPWTVGRYKTPAAFDNWAKNNYPEDLKTTRANGQEYMPVIYPGFSWRGTHPSAALNQIPRYGGDFLWQQGLAAKKAGATMIKVAMFDEINEATAIFKVVTTQDQTPDDGEWVTLDADGKTLPSDHYLKLTGRIGRLLKD